MENGTHLNWCKQSKLANIDYKKEINKEINRTIKKLRNIITNNFIMLQK